MKMQLNLFIIEINSRFFLDGKIIIKIKDMLNNNFT